MEHLYHLKEKTDEQVCKLEACILKNIKEKNKKKAAENSRELARILYKKNNLVYALEKYNEAAYLHHEIGLYERELGDRFHIIDIHNERNDLLGLAKEYGRIAGVYKENLKKEVTARYFFDQSSLYYEKIGNYIACHKQAYQGYKCCGSNNDDKYKFLSKCIRSCIKQNINKKVVYYIGLMSEIIDSNKFDDIKDADGKRLSLYRKGYFSAKKLGENGLIVEYLRKIIDIHIKKGVLQEDIQIITREYALAYIKENRKLDKDLETVIDSIFTDNNQKAIILNDLSNICYEMRAIEEGRKLKIKSNDCMLKKYKENNEWLKFITNWTWKLVSDYGESFFRWSIVSLLLVIVFAAIYCGLDLWNPGSIYVGRSVTRLTPLYFSCVTFTTLGFGEIYPTTVLAEIVVIFEVVIGYIMLGGIVSIFSKKMFR